MNKVVKVFMFVLFIIKLKIVNSFLKAVFNLQMRISRSRATWKSEKQTYALNFLECNRSAYFCGYFLVFNKQQKKQPVNRLYIALLLWKYTKYLAYMCMDSLRILWSSLLSMILNKRIIFLQMFPVTKAIHNEDYPKLKK